VWWQDAVNPKVQPPRANRYGSDAVWNSSVVGAWIQDNFADSTVNANDGTGTGTTISTDAPFGVGSWEFDGVDDRVVVPDSSSLDLTSAVFIELWFKTNSDTGDFQGLVTKRTGATSANYSLGFDVGSTMNWGFYSGGWQEETSTFTTDFGTATWYRFVGTLDDVGADVDVEYFKNTTSITSGTKSSVVIAANADTLKFGNIENVASTFTSYPLDGFMKAIILHSTIPSSDIQTTLDNNQTAPGTFWDHSFAVTTPTSSSDTGAAALLYRKHMWY
jgi:hypothetical protein